MEATTTTLVTGFNHVAVDPEGMAFEVCCFRTGDVIADGEYEIGH